MAATAAAIEAILATPDAQRWLNAHSEPLASIYTFSRYAKSILLNFSKMRHERFPFIIRICIVARQL